MTADGIVVALFVATAILQLGSVITALVLIVRSEERDFVESSRAMWVIIVLLGGFVGALVWYFVDWRKRGRSVDGRR